MKTVAEYTAEKLKQLQTREAKDKVVQKRVEETTSEDRAVVAKFYQALAAGPAAHAEANEVIAKDWNDKLKKAYGDDWEKKAQAVGTVGSGTTGGLLVPTTVADSIIKRMYYVSPMRQISTVLSDMPAQLQLPSENAIAQAYWVAEGAPGTDSGEVFDPNLLTPQKAMCLDSFSSEVLADAATNPSLQNFVEGRLVVALALLENTAFVNGDGSGKPYGFRSSAITPNSIAQAQDTLTYNDITGLKYTINTAYRQLGVYVTSSQGAQALEDVKDNQGRPIWRMGLAEGAPDTVSGRPLHVVDEIPSNLGTSSIATEIWFGLFSNYFIGDRGAMRVDYGTNGTDFANDKISLRVAKRVAGRPVIGSSFGVLSGVVAG